MKITVLASGSKGNITLIETKKYNILIDAGINYKNIRNRLENDLPKIDYIIITHIHIDHVYGLRSFIKMYNPTLLTMCNEIEKFATASKIIYDSSFNLDGLEVELFEVSHDTPCWGVIIKENNKELVYATDTGYIHKNVLDKITNKDIYIIESNHDEQMLRNGRYPFYLQQRIRSTEGHLSNETTASYLKKIIGDNTLYVVLAHISEENNNPEIAYHEALKSLEKHKNIKGLYTAKQHETLETIEV